MSEVRRGAVLEAGTPPLAGPALFIAALAASVLYFWPGIASLVDAWATPEYSHGPLIPLISLFLMLREMRAVPPVDRPVTDRWPGLVVIVLGLLLGTLGRVTEIHHFVTYGLMVWAAGLIITLFGLRRGALFWPAVVHLVFMLPLPQFVYWQVSTYLQTVSSEIGVGIIAALGVPVYLDGNIIDLGVYKLQVAEACSGLRYLFPMLSFSYVFAVLYRGPVWHKLLILASAAPITVAMNSFRIGVIGVMVDNFGIEQAEGFLHAFEGWIIFIACVAILFGLAAVLQRLTPDPKPLSETLDIEFAGLGAQFRRLGDVRPSAALAAVLALTLLAAAASALAPERASAAAPREPLALFPETLPGGWVGRPEGALDPAVERVLAADDYLSMTYANPATAATVNLFIAYYRDQTDGTGIHSPEVCLPGGGWEVSQWDQIRLDLPAGEVETNRAIIQMGTVRQLVYFWFDLRGRRIASDYEAKFANVLDSAIKGRSDGALVRLITPLAPGEPVEAADARLRALAAKVVEETPRFVPF